ncbi:unnamed protein product [Natator depressus]
MSYSGYGNWNSGTNGVREDCEGPWREHLSLQWRCHQRAWKKLCSAPWSLQAEGDSQHLEPCPWKHSTVPRMQKRKLERMWICPYSTASREECISPAVSEAIVPIKG